MYWKGFGKKETRDDEVKDGRSGKHKATHCCNQVSQLPNYITLPSPFAPADSCFRKFLFLRSKRLQQSSQ